MATSYVRPADFANSVPVGLLPRGLDGGHPAGDQAPQRHWRLMRARARRVIWRAAMNACVIPQRPLPRPHHTGRQTAVAPRHLPFREQGPIMTELKASPRRAARTTRLAAVAGALVAAVLGTPAVAAAPPPRPLYLALGDSVAVGVGAQPPARPKGTSLSCTSCSQRRCPAAKDRRWGAVWTSSTSLYPGRRRTRCSRASSLGPSP